MDKEMVMDVVREEMGGIGKEKDYREDRMGEVLGVWKRHLEEVEKKRVGVNWREWGGVCGLLRDSEIVKGRVGDEGVEILEVVGDDELHV
ncbi:hypothetical protein [Bacillus sp. WP8]|uniref:hypothetical protein n=1 Tax=Bacillus sp. WP8 TaxID=756828 RepID=UPI00119F6477|nr:hypothetical protein [Bacillus sp. WP8]